MKNPDKPTTFHHGYATANDKKLYIDDVKNLLRIASTPSSVDKHFLYIAISQVYPTRFWDTLFIKLIKRLFNAHPFIILVDIFFKPNLGRDFSSYDAILSKITANHTQSSDYIFLQNRSAIGPYIDDWQNRFIHQFIKYDNIALCGSTINFSDHHSRSDATNCPHVQTYTLLSTFNCLQPIHTHFPGATEHSREKIITEGEIGLSQLYLNNHYAITCLEWPDAKITLNSTPITQTDIKKEVKKDHPFYHRSFKLKNTPYSNNIVICVVSYLINKRRLMKITL